MSEASGFDRRMFLRAAGVAAGAVALGGAGALLTGEADAKRVKQPRQPSWPDKNLIQFPPVVDVASLSAPYELTARNATVNIGGGQMASIWSYDGRMPGPTFFARTGDNVRINLLNELAQDHITHWHGLVAPYEDDGHPMSQVPTGSSYSYDFPIVQRASLNFYHPHTDMMTGEQVAMGMAGGFLIRDDEEVALGLPSGEREVPLVLRDATLDASSNMKFSGASKGFFGTFPLVNGIQDAYMRVHQAVYRFRILAGTNARVWQLKLSNDAAFTLIGNDGGLLASSTQVARLDLSPGERADVLIDFRQMPVGTQLLLQDVGTGWDLLGFLVSRSASDPYVLPTTLSTIAPLSNPVRTRTFTFDGMSAINGLSYDMHRVDFQVPLGDTERWVFSSGGSGPHPVHVHGASFQVISRTGGRGQLYPWESGWKDTVLLEDNETVEILIRFEHYRSLYLIHCHQLGHEDGGMMSNFEVV